MNESIINKSVTINNKKSKDTPLVDHNKLYSGLLAYFSQLIYYFSTISMFTHMVDLEDLFTLK